MSNVTLAGLVGSLLVAVGLAATNPTMDAYVHFVEARLLAEIEKMDQSGPRHDRYWCWVWPVNLCPCEGSRRRR